MSIFRTYNSTNNFPGKKISYNRLVLGTISKKDLKSALRIGEIKTTTKTKLIEIGKKHASKKYN